MKQQALCVLSLMTALIMTTTFPAAAAEKPGFPQNTNVGLTTGGAHLSMREVLQQEGARPADVAAGVTVASQLEWRSTLACGNVTNADANDNPTGCGMALKACVTPTAPGAVLYYAWFRRAGSSDAWQYGGQDCSSTPMPGVPPPAVPSMGEIRTAFANLVFGKPVVMIQPVGGTTLVNLPTYYEIRWDGTGLEPGQVSAPVQLLSWSVEFEPIVRSFDVDYGDGTSSGPTTEVGGPYPSGSIRHTYLQPVDAAQVKVDAVLTGRFRVNGGDWIDVDGVADLQDEPVTVLRVAEARARLYSG